MIFATSTDIMLSFATAFNMIFYLFIFFTIIIFILYLINPSNRKS